MRGIITLLAYIATIPVANWMIGNVGSCIPNGPCVIQVGFGLMAPSGVLMIGAALVLRDAVHTLLGWRWAVFAIFSGVAISASFAPPALVLASATAFLVSEMSDFAVYAKLRSRNIALAVLASGTVGAGIDSAVFLSIAFGSMDFFAGQMMGKIWATIAVAGYFYARAALAAMETPA